VQSGATPAKKKKKFTPPATSPDMVIDLSTTVGSQIGRPKSIQSTLPHKKKAPAKPSVPPADSPAPAATSSTTGRKKKPRSVAAKQSKPVLKQARK
jgi:hypothetical protein